jgi:transcriptional regulator with XRE-family HTH domain
MKETLSEYLDRVMKQKRLKPRDIEERAGISNSYISKLLSGEKSNVGAPTIVALAQALEVSPFEIFSVVAGVEYEEQTIDPLVVIEALEIFMNLPRNDQKSILQTMKALAQDRKKKKPKEKPKEK